MGGYIGFAVLAAGCIPLLYAPLKWYMVLMAFALAPVFSVANAYGCGVTDWDQVRPADCDLRRVSGRAGLLLLLLPFYFRLHTLASFRHPVSLRRSGALLM